MTSKDFRRIVLGMKDTMEGAHMGHPDFRVHGKIFASLQADETWGTVKLTPEDQRRFVDDDPETFVPAAGAWGVQGWTRIQLATADEDTAGEALTLGWQLTSASARKQKPPKGSATKGSASTRSRRGSKS